MKKHHYDIVIEAATESEADTKMAALTILASKLTAQELKGLAHIVKTDPAKTAMAKKYLGV